MGAVMDAPRCSIGLHRQTHERSEISAAPNCLSRSEQGQKATYNNSIAKMPYEFKFPDVGEGIHEGELVKWLAKEWDKVNADQSIAEVETDKAVVEMPSPKKGTIAKLHFKEGDTITVGQVFVTIALEGEDAKAVSASAPAAAASPAPVPTGEVYTGSVVGFVEEAKEGSPIYGRPQQAPPPSSSSPGVQATLAVRK